jgi:hypothetical protein
MPVSIQAHPDAGKPFAEIGGVVVVERFFELIDRRVRQGLSVRVEPGQTGYFNGPIVHPPALGLPGHQPVQSVEEGIRAGNPTTPDIDPGTISEVGPMCRRSQQSPRADGILRVQQRTLKHQHRLAVYTFAERVFGFPVPPIEVGN